MCNLTATLGKTHVGPSIKSSRIVRVGPLLFFNEASIGPIEFPFGTADALEWAHLYSQKSSPMAPLGPINPIKEVADALAWAHLHSQEVIADGLAWAR